MNEVRKFVPTAKLNGMGFLSSILQALLSINNPKGTGRAVGICKTPRWAPEELREKVETVS
jgi:hypothetical protein